MDMLTHVSINLFPMVMLFVIYGNNRKKTIKSRKKDQFNVLLLIVMLLMLIEILCYGVEGAHWKGADIWLWGFYMIHAIFVVGVSWTWLIYALGRLKADENGMCLKWVKRIGRVVVGAFVLFTVMTPWTRLLFTITEDGRYIQGPRYFFTYVISTLFLVTMVVITFQYCRHEPSAEKRAEGYCLLVCGIAPLVGIIIQYFGSDWWLVAPMLSLSVLFIYLNAQNRQIITDSLTGLNNRREFDQYIAKKPEQSRENHWGMLMLDVDDFKMINDNLGHNVGDEALWEAADILRRTLGNEKTFLARYGGDEFAVLGDWSDEGDVRAAISRIEEEVVRFNKQAGKEYQLSLSIGYAMWEEADDVKQLVERADERMYAVKMRKKAVQSI